ncbi:MAG: lipoprotein [Methylococcus sp.]|jgi:predicted small lipoprotein YifL
MIIQHRWLLLWVLAFFLPACGQKGPLFKEGQDPRSRGGGQSVQKAPEQKAPIVEPSAPN